MNGLETMPTNQVIAMATMTKNQGNRLKEWVLYHNKLGINLFIIFLDNCSDNSKQILNNIKNEFNIKIDIYETEILNPNSLNVHWIERSHIMYDYVLKIYSNQVNWIAFVEVDEFIFNYKNNIMFNEYLDNLDSKCLYINSWDFKGPFNENTKILGQSYLCWSNEHRFNNGYRYRGKSIIRPKYFNKCMDAHHFRMNDNIVSDEFKKNRGILQVSHGKEVYIDDSIFRIGHFRNHSPHTNDTDFIEWKYD